MNALTSIRWWLWERASWLAWWLCPDKKALRLVMQHGSIMSRAAMDAVNRRRSASQQGGE